jgi:hypothetical protein
MGAHYAGIMGEHHVGWYDTSLDSLYSSRICTRCDKGVVDDEQHWLFDCDALGGIRQNHASTIERYPSLPELMAAVWL